MTAKALQVNPRKAYRSWMFTINNPMVARLPQDFIDQCEFVTYQMEADDNGTPHFQGYLVLKENPTNKNGRCLSWVREHLYPFAHWTPKEYGTHDACVAYCNKEDTRVEGPWTHGEWHETRGQQKGGEKNASKILQIKRMIDDGASEHDIWQGYFGEALRYGKGFDRYRMTLTNTFRQHQTQAVWFYGPAHTGKSHRARALALKMDQEPYYLKLSTGNQWFDGMRPGCKCVVIEDFRGQAPISFMLTLLDHTPMNVETKGSMMPFAAEWVIFTSNQHPRDVYGQQPEHKIPLEVLNAWHSRFEGSRGCIIEMKDVFKVPDRQKTIDTIQQIEAGILPFHVDLTTDEELSEDSQDRKVRVVEDNDEPDAEEAEGYEAWDDDAEEHRRATGQQAWLDEDHLASQPYDERTPRHFVTGLDRLPPKVYCDCMDIPCDGANLLKKLRRTDTSTLGIEKVADKRWGPEPVQSKLKFSARREILSTEGKGLYGGDDDNDN